jgi:hypothetical protein
MHRASSPPPRRQHSIHCRWTSTTNTVYSTLWPTPKKSKNAYYFSLAAITYIFILFSFLFSDFIPSPLLPIDDPFFSNARSFGSYRFRTRMYSVSRKPATKEEYKEEKEVKKHILGDFVLGFTITRKISLGFTFDI